MEKDFDNTDKEKYLSPVLIEYGTVDSLTQNNTTGPYVDADLFSTTSINPG